MARLNSRCRARSSRWRCGPRSSRPGVLGDSGGGVLAVHVVHQPSGPLDEVVAAEARSAIADLDQPRLHRSDAHRILLQLISLHALRFCEQRYVGRACPLDRKRGLSRWILSSLSACDTPSANTPRSGTASASPTMAKFSCPAYERTPTPTVTFPCTTPTWNSSRTRAPAKYSGTGGPGRLLVNRLTSLWRNIARTIQVWANRPPGSNGGRRLPSAAASAIALSRRMGSGSPTGSGASLIPTTFPPAWWSAGRRMDTATETLSTRSRVSSPRCSSSRRAPPATAASTTSLTFAP